MMPYCRYEPYFRALTRTAHPTYALIRLRQGRGRGRCRSRMRAWVALLILRRQQPGDPERRERRRAVREQEAHEPGAPAVDGRRRLTVSPFKIICCKVASQTYKASCVSPALLLERHIDI